MMISSPGYRICANKPPAVYKNQGFEVAVYCNFTKFYPKKHQKWGLFEFCVSGGLIKSGGLLAQIW